MPALPCSGPTLPATSPATRRPARVSPLSPVVVTGLPLVLHVGEAFRGGSVIHGMHQQTSYMTTSPCHLQRPMTSTNACCSAAGVRLQQTSPSAVQPHFWLVTAQTCKQTGIQPAMCSHSAPQRTLGHVDQRDSVVVRRTCGLREPLLPERARAAAPPEPERVAAAGGMGRACAQAPGASCYLGSLLPASHVADTQKWARAQPDTRGCNTLVNQYHIGPLQGSVQKSTQHKGNAAD